ncbi:MAG TPA: hypothetical protein VJH97_02945 [Candidatus Nanoarchaeia archaeon]|nr:hypothetical protein [Candidatus Nanoarchaeia archaeon]
MEEKSQAVKEYKQAFDEFYKDKPEPKDKEESKKMLEEFFHWYNNVRKQSDIGKTPAEMYKEIYGVGPSKTVDLDEGVEEGINEEEIEDLREFFDRELWPKLKKDLKEATKKEACFISFLAGTEISNNMFEEEMKHTQKTFENMTPEEITKMIKKEENPKMREESLWAEGGFMETLGPIDIKERMKTFHKKHDEDMNYECKKCGKKISAHNKDWHAYMCDECFNEECYPGEQEEKIKTK